VFNHYGSGLWCWWIMYLINWNQSICVLIHKWQHFIIQTPCFLLTQSIARSTTSLALSTSSRRGANTNREIVMLKNLWVDSKKYPEMENYKKKCLIKDEQWITVLSITQRLPDSYLSASKTCTLMILHCFRDSRPTRCYPAAARYSKKKPQHWIQGLFL